VLRSRSTPAAQVAVPRLHRSLRSSSYVTACSASPCGALLFGPALRFYFADASLGLSCVSQLRWVPPAIQNFGKGGLSPVPIPPLRVRFELCIFSSAFCMFRRAFIFLRKTRACREEPSAVSADGRGRAREGALPSLAGRQPSKKLVEY
jgi:hypothetical protein